MKTVITDFRIDVEEKRNLERLGCRVINCGCCHELYEAVCGHPDMLMHLIDENTIIVHKNMLKNIIEELSNCGKKVIISKTSLCSKYPYDISLNALNIKNFFVHNLKYTDKTLLKYVSHKNLINVKQGYTKCSTAIISENAIITSDTHIAEVLKKQYIDVLLLPPGDIILPGLNYGFIGGTCGLLDDNTICFYGDLKYYKYGKEVLFFLDKHKILPIFLRNGPLFDRGSIFSI